MSSKPVLQVNIHDAKTHLSRYISRVESGETLLIARSGKPVAKLVPIDEVAKAKFSILGAMAGQGVIENDVWRQMDKEIEEMFEESANRPL